MAKTLAALRPGESGIVDRVTGAGELRRRLLDLGLTPGATVVLKKRAPFGDPVEIAVRGYTLTLRTAEARWVELT